MSGTYKATGINLKSTPLGESDRLLTLLTEEYGLIRAVAPGCRKQNSSLSGRSSLFVVNQLLIAKGKTLDKIIQAESSESFPGLGQDLRKLTASQYLAELTLYQALSDQPQPELFALLKQSLHYLEQQPAALALVCLNQAIVNLMTLAGLAPQVHSCCVTQTPIVPDLTNPDWRVGFSAVAGGVVQVSRPSLEWQDLGSVTQLSATELKVLQLLAPAGLDAPMGDGSWQLGIASPAALPHAAWLSVERVLRHYAQYHFDRPIRSATLIDTCFLVVDSPAVSQTP